MKTVFTNAMCAHVWAQLSQPHGRSDSMRFDGAVGYSYQTPVAHIITPKGHAPIVLMRGSDWGPATNKHLILYRNASSQYRQFEVPRVVWGNYKGADSSAHGSNVKHLTKCYTDERDALLRVPCDSWRVEQNRAHDTLSHLATQVKDYQVAFGLNVTEMPWIADAAAATARRDRLANDPKRAAKRAKAAAARELAHAAKQAALVIEYAANLAEWRAGERDYVSRDLPIALRIKGDVVQTSLGAEVPLEHAKRALVFYRLMVADKRLPWERNERATLLDATTVGQFKLDSIDADGNVRAGCHTISRAELEHFGKLLEGSQS